MTFICLLRGCQWRSMLSEASGELACECCERCGAVRYHLLKVPSR